jgi:hypothetical protein
MNGWVPKPMVDLLRFKPAAGSREGALGLVKSDRLRHTFRQADGHPTNIGLGFHHDERPKTTEESRMNSIDNPFSRQKSPGHSARVAEIIFWARQSLALADEATVSVNEFGCQKPTCPRNRTTILVMSEEAPTRQFSIHKSILEINESDVFDACVSVA